MAHLPLILFASVLILSTSVRAAPSCADVELELLPCQDFLTRQQEQPASSCCSGVSDLSSYQNRKEDRVSICQCLESLAGNYSNVDLSRLLALPSMCDLRVSLPPVSSVHFNCSQA